MTTQGKVTITHFGGGPTDLRVTNTAPNIVIREVCAAMRPGEEPDAHDRKMDAQNAENEARWVTYFLLAAD